MTLARCAGSEVGERTEALLAVLKNPAYHFKRIGLELDRVAMALQRSRRAGLQ